MQLSTEEKTRRKRISERLSRENPSLHHHLFGGHPKRILALDGGGVLGVIEIAFLEEIEALLRKRFGNEDLVLSDYFDLIGGTSTGSVIATALALGMSTKDVKDLYFNFARDIFKRPLFSVPGIGSKFDARALANKLRGILRERTMQSEDLKTGLAVIAKRVDTGSPWVLSNHPAMKYWEDPLPNSQTKKPDYLGNKNYKIRELVRASTAAPFLLQPKTHQDCRKRTAWVVRRRWRLAL